MLHWGHDLGDVSAADLAALAVAAVPGTVPNDLDDAARAVALLPEHAAGWNGRPGLAGLAVGAGMVAPVHPDRIRRSPPSGG